MSMIFFYLSGPDRGPSGGLDIVPGGDFRPGGTDTVGDGGIRLRIWDLGQRPSGRPGSRAPAEQKAQL